MKITIKNKLLICFSIIIVLTVAFQLVFNTFLTDTLYLAYKEKCMEDAFYNIKTLYTGSSTNIEDIAEEIENAQNVQITIWNEEAIVYSTQSINKGTVILIEPQEPQELQGPQELQEPQEPQEPQEQRGEVQSTKPDHSMDYSILPSAEEVEQYSRTPSAETKFNADGEENLIELTGVFVYSGQKIYVRMVLPMTSVTSSSSFYVSVNSVIGVVILLFGLFLSIYVSRSVTKNIEDVEKVARNLANMDFTEFASEDSGTKEVASLACSVNQMSKELSCKIQELNEANAKLQEDVDHQKRIDEMRKEFVANISHELKTPLAILQFYGANLKSDISGIDKEYYYDTIIEETERMNDMVKSMLDISQLENGFTKMEMQEMNLSATVRHTMNKLTPLLSDYQVNTEIEDNILVNGDENYIEQAIKNYVTNASVHTAIGREIRIELRREGDIARFIVYNEGCHIEESQMDQIWDSFYKADKSRVRTENTNVGLGLYIVRSIVNNHSGKYGVRNVENGVEFSFELTTI